MASGCESEGQAQVQAAFEPGLPKKTNKYTKTWYAFNH